MIESLLTLFFGFMSIFFFYATIRCIKEGPSGFRKRRIEWEIEQARRKRLRDMHMAIYKSQKD